MPQYFWKVDNIKGIDYEVSLYHGDRSGHVIIYSGAKILFIDFGIHSDKEYSFMLGDTLYVLRITFPNQRPSYTLVHESSKKIILPIGDYRHLRNHNLMAVGLALMIVLLVVLAVMYIF